MEIHFATLFLNTIFFNKFYFERAIIFYRNKAVIALLAFIFFV